MFRIVGGARRLCDGITRRELFRLGGLATLGLSLPHLLAREAAAAERGTVRGRAKSCILFFQEGGMAHQDTWDPKPDAPDGVGGEFGAIRTAVPGVYFSDQIPRLAAIADRLALVRSVTHDITDHNAGAYYCLTGRSPKVGNQLILGDRRTNFPGYGAVMARLRPARHAVPDFVHIPAILTNNGEDLPGQRAGWLGPAYDPILIGDPTLPSFRTQGLSAPPIAPPERLARRRSLLQRVQSHLEHLAETGPGPAADVFYAKAFDLLTSERTRRACNLDEEPPAVREWYGPHHMGQSFLLARRLIQAGVRLVTVCWGPRSGSDSNQNWDTHRRNFYFLREHLLPPTDRGLAALILDLERLGMLEETLVVCMGEFGRTPEINAQAGRDHWPYCYTVMFAGGGIRGGAVYGASDAKAAFPKEDAVTPEDVAATIYAALGLDPHTEIRDPAGRPFPIALGQPIAPLFD